MKKLLMILMTTALLVGLMAVSAFAAPRGNDRHHDGPSYRPSQRSEMNHCHPAHRPQPARKPEMKRQPHHKPEIKHRPNHKPEISYRPAPRPQKPSRRTETVVVYEDNDSDVGSFVAGVILGIILEK